jgi:molecular chaperone GrpE
MSFPDEATPSEEVGSGSAGSSEDETWSDADSAAVEAEAESAGGPGAGGGAGTGGGNGAPVLPDVFALDPIQQLENERDEYLLALQRTQADFENYRKRITRMQEEQSARAASALVTKLLPVLDTLDLALAHQTEASAQSEDAKALVASRSMLLDVMAKEGLERLDQAEVPFDPAVHDAVAKVEADGGEVMVDEVLRSGYRWKGQVLRPAMVRVRG